MKLIVDANIIFSSILNTNSKIAFLIFQGGDIFEFIAPQYLKDEITRHQAKIAKIKKLPLADIISVKESVYRQISFFDEKQIPESIWETAAKIVSDIDPKDVAYLTMALFHECKLWSGDKELTKGLLRKNHDIILNVNEVFEKWKNLK